MESCVEYAQHLGVLTSTRSLGECETTEEDGSEAVEKLHADIHGSPADANW